MDRYDLTITGAGETHGLLCDWSRGGAGLTIKKATNPSSTAVSTKGDYGVRDVEDYFRIVQTDWSEGQGQPTYDRDADSENAYWESRSIDISTVGELRMGPKVTETALTPTLPCVIAHGTSSGTPIVWGSFTDASTARQRVRWSTNGTSWTALSNTGSTTPDGSPVSFASDGETLYMASSTGHVYTVTAVEATQFAGTDGDAVLGTGTHNITHLAWTAGYLYGAKGSASIDAQLGYWTSAPAWTALSPDVSAAINAAGTTFGLVASGSYVYWGVTNGMVTKVFKARYGGGTGADTLQTVATFPTGFVGASMTAYLGTVYVGGHFDWTTVNTGIGAIYAIVNDTPALLTDVGTDRTKDNRVLALSCYERSLYFVSDSKLWRWDLVHGGYSHYAGPLNSTDAIVYSSITWTKTYDFAAAPTGAVASGTGTIEYNYMLPAAYAVSMDCNQSSEVVDVYVPETGIDSSLGTTLEVDLPASCIPTEIGSLPYGGADLTQHLLYGYIGLTDAAEGVRVNFARSGSGLIGNLKSGTSLLASFTIGALTSAHTIRLTLQGTTAKVYVGNVLVGQGTTYGSASTERILYGAENASGSSSLHGRVLIDRMRFVTGVYDPSVSTETAVSGVGLCCWRDHVLAACTGYGEVITSPTQYATTLTDGEAPYLTASRTAGNMPTVDKYFSALHVTLAAPLPATCTISAVANIDGFNHVISTSSDSTDYLLVLPINQTGRTLQVKLILDNSDAALTPVVTEVAVLFEPTPKVPKSYTYFIRCWRDAEDNAGYDWDEDAPTVADWLEEIAGDVVLVERAGRDSYNGRIEALELQEAPPSGKANGREGLYAMQVKVI